ncbi:MAG: RNA polymerase sigma factor [Neomegalonema sp.]|nr:RNA polymerase sigma factor [Neomegalonema sp.]
MSATEEFEQRLRALTPQLRRFAQALAETPDDGDDFAQTTLLRAVAQRRQYSSAHLPLDAWLYRIACAVWRQANDAAIVEADGDGLPAALDTTEAALSPERLRTHFKQLQPLARGALILACVDGKSYVAIAAILSLSTSETADLLAEARRDLLDMRRRDIDETSLINVEDLSIGSFRSAGALVDGVLTEQARQELQNRATSELEIALLIEELHGLTAQLIEAYPTPDDGVAGARLKRLVADSSWKPVSPAPFRRRLPPRTQRMVAATAFFCLGALCALAFLSSDAPPPRHITLGVAPATSPLGQALSTTPSGKSRRDGLVRWTPIGTYATASGQACREFKLVRGRTVREIGVACRIDGSWVVEIAVQADHLLQPAPKLRGDERLLGRKARQEFLTRLGAGKALKPETEESLLELWRR